MLIHEVRTDSGRRIKAYSICIKGSWELPIVDGSKVCLDCQKLQGFRRLCLKCNDQFKPGCKSRFLCVHCYNANHGRWN